LRYRIQEISNLCGGIVFLFFLITLFANDIKEFAIPFSVIGAGIAFSLQEIITSIAGRISIISSNLFQIGDRIQVGDIQGDVIHIGFLRTSLMEIGNWVKADQYTGRVIHVTNSMILKDNLINYSATFPFVWDEVVVPVRYGSDQHLARKIILDVTNKTTQDFQIKAKESWSKVRERYMIEQSNFSSSVTLIANDNWLEFTARYVVLFNQRRLVKDQLCTQYVDAFSESSGKVEYDSMTIEITNFPQLKVDLNKEKEK
jgi:small-conductance mechanosensitive channel